MKANRKVIISTFASNVNRVQQIVEACIKTNRKLALLGRSMVNVVEVALEKGYLNIPDGMLIEANEVNNVDPKQVAILCTGSQGEPMAALARLASGNYRQVDVLDISNQVAIQSRKIQAGNIYVDGLGIGDVGNALLRDRKQLSEDGMLVIVITFNKVDGEIISGPDIISRGFVYVRDSEEFLKELNKLAVITINNVKKEKVNSWGILKREPMAALARLASGNYRQVDYLYLQHLHYER